VALELLSCIDGGYVDFTVLRRNPIKPNNAGVNKNAAVGTGMAVGISIM